MGVVIVQSFSQIKIETFGRLCLGEDQACQQDRTPLLGI